MVGLGLVFIFRVILVGFKLLEFFKKVDYVILNGLCI